MSMTKRKRCSLMLWAFLVFHMRKASKPAREAQSWLLLLEWARLGGRRDEEIRC